jgi:hypothetical protein
LFLDVQAFVAGGHSDYLWSYCGHFTLHDQAKVVMGKKESQGSKRKALAPAVEDVGRGDAAAGVSSKVRV